MTLSPLTHLPKWLSLIVGISLLTACSQLMLRQTCVALATNINYCLAPLPLSSSLPAGLPKPTPKSESTPKDAPQANTNKPNSSPASQHDNKSVTQKVTIQVRKSSHELLSQVELDSQQLTMVGLAPLGQALFTLVYDGTILTSEQSMLLGEEFKAEYLMALMQLIYWPIDELTPYLQGAVLTSPACTMALCRELYANADAVQQQTSMISIKYSRLDPWEADVILSIPNAELQLTISPL